MRDHARLVALGFLAQARRRALRLRDHVVGVGLAFVLRTLAVGARLERVVERGLHLLGRLHVLHVDVGHRDAGLQPVELRLDRLDELGGDRVALLVQHRVHVALADDLAHGRLGGHHDRVLRVLVLEQEGARVLQAVLHREADVDDVLVLRQHRRVAQAGGRHHGVAPHFLGTQRRHRHRFVRLEGIRHAPLEAGVHRVAVAAEGHHHRLLAGLHDEEAAAQPDQRHHGGDQAHADAGALHVGLEVVAAVAGAVAARPAAAEQPAQLAVEVTPQLIEVGGAVAAAAGGEIGLALDCTE
jgi:hypothetical protein